MIVTLKSKVPIELDINSLIEDANIENGETTTSIKQKIERCIQSYLQIPEDMSTNVKEICDILYEETLNHLYYYVIM